jgi:hypothetical protein
MIGAGLRMLVVGTGIGGLGAARAEDHMQG